VVSSWTDAELYRRGCATLFASWAEYARACEALAMACLPPDFLRTADHGGVGSPPR